MGLWGGPIDNVIRVSTTMSFPSIRINNIETNIHRSVVTIVSTYRDVTSILEYIVAGSITAAMFSFNRGIKGIGLGGINE